MRETSKFGALDQLEDNWDGHGSLARSSTMLAEARAALALLHAGALGRNIRWEDLHIGVNERGEITMEWWQGERSLTVFVRSEGSIDYLKAWGTDIETQMEDGSLSSLSDFASLSSWLYLVNII